jgi:hypothetical protein
MNLQIYIHILPFSSPPFNKILIFCFSPQFLALWQQPAHQIISLSVAFLSIPDDPAEAMDQ